MILIDKEELLQALENKYGDLTDNSGCSVSTETGWEWLSIVDVVEIINNCIKFDN